MISFNGTRLNAGVAFGKVKIIGRHGNNIVRQKTSDSSFEVERLTHAIDTAEAELIKMLDKIDKSHVQEITILEAQKVLLKDAELVKSTIKMIREELVTAEYAVYSVGNTYIELLENIDDEYMRARALDVKDIISRITRGLVSGRGPRSGKDERQRTFRRHTCHGRRYFREYQPTGTDHCQSAVPRE